jgi:hypothetical protein
MFFPGNARIKKLMVPSESASQELSNEWSCQYILTVPSLVTEVTISPQRVKFKPTKWLRIHEYTMLGLTVISDSFMVTELLRKV